MAMPRNEIDMAAAIDISRGRRPRRSMKKSEPAVANMKSTAMAVERIWDGSSGSPTLLWRTRGR